jgi:GT2 family glycosyltransferase
VTGAAHNHDEVISPSAVSIVIVNWNGESLLRTCLGAVAAQERPADEIIVVDNGSSDDSVALVRSEFPDVRLVELPVNEGFAGGANAGIGAARSPWVAMLNNDAAPEPKWLAELLAAAGTLSSTTGFLTSKILDADGRTIDSAGDYVDRAFTAHQRGHGLPADDPQWGEAVDLMSACAAATIYRKSYFDDVGLFDERFFAYFEDVDLCLRGAWRGWGGRYVPSARVRHATSSTSSRVPGFKRYQGTRNAWWLLYKNAPHRGRAGFLSRFLLTQLIWLWSAGREGEMRWALRGHVDGVRGLRQFRRDRRSIRQGARVADDDIAAALAEPVAIRQAAARVRTALKLRRARG